MPARTTREVLDQYREAFRRHDPSLLDDLVADDCVIEDTSPAPDGSAARGRRRVPGAMVRAGGEPLRCGSRRRWKRSTAISPSHRGPCSGATARTIASAA